MGSYKNNTANIEIRTLRDEIAIAAMQGLCAYSGTYGVNNNCRDIAKRAYEIATAMLEARKEKP